jgi:hypothetical protein
MKKLLKYALALSFTAVAGLPVASFALQATPAPAAAAPTKPAKPAKTGAATADQIADAKSKGLVWVNLNTKVYHNKDDRYYGTTKNGQFMTEADAQKAGAHLAGAGAVKSKAATPAAK